MSTTVMSACWPLKMPPTPKAVLISLADNANDHGYCWPSLTKISERTCFGRTAVIDAIKWLEDTGAIKADRTDRYRTTYVVTPESFSPSELVREANQSAKRTSTADGELVRLADDEVRETDDEVRQADTNRQEPSITINKSNRQQTREQVALPEWLDRQAWADWLDHRKKLRKPMTPRAMELTIEKLAGMRRKGHDPTAVINHAIENGWQGIYLPRPEPQERPANASSNRSTGRKLSAVEQVEQAIRERRERDGPESGAVVRIGYG